MCRYKNRRRHLCVPATCYACMAIFFAGRGTNSPPFHRRLELSRGGNRVPSSSSVLVNTIMFLLHFHEANSIFKVSLKVSVLHAPKSISIYRRFCRFQTRRSTPCSRLASQVKVTCPVRCTGFVLEHLDLVKEIDSIIPRSVLPSFV